MKYKYFLFDVDNTLLDFGDTEKQALFGASKIHGIPCTEEDYKRYSKINDDCWKMLEKGQIEKSQIGFMRFSNYLPTVNAKVDPLEFNKTFISQLALGKKLIDGANEVVKAVKDLGGKVYIATNGFFVVQENRLKCQEFFKYVDGLFISEQLGHAKPDVRFFEEAEKLAGITLKGNALIIGDSLTSDIKGGSDYGIDTCWFNPNGLPIPTEPKITFTINKLSELIDKIK